MSDRGFLFLFSSLMVIGGLGAAGWLLASGQADTVDGLFMMLTLLLMAAIFGLYLVFLIRRAMSAVSAPVAEKAKAGAAAAGARPAALRS